MSATTIRSLHVQTLDIPLWESFGISGGAQQVANNLLVTLELADGTRGYGEAAPFPSFNGETQQMAHDAILAAKEVLEGADVRQWRQLCQQLQTRVSGVGSALCALETAILDALTRHYHMPLWAFLGGASTQLETDMTLPIPATSNAAEAVEHAASSARAIVGYGIRTIKIKVGGKWDADLQRIEAVHDNAPEASLILDGNAGYPVADSALKLLESLGEKGIVPILFEQPLPKDDLPGLRTLTQSTNVPIAADESAYSVAAVRQLIEQEVVTAINIKLMKCGIVEALDIAALCRSAGIGLMIGGMVESPLAMSMSACFAGGLGGFDYIDLDTPFFMESIPLRGGCYRQSGNGRGEVRPILDLRDITEGHGVEPYKL